MFLSPRTVGVLATVVASLATAGPAADTPLAPPTITSVAVNGADLEGSDGTFYTNNIDDDATLTVTGDASASSFDLFETGAPLSQTPVTDAVATFTFPALSSGDNYFGFTQTTPDATSEPFVGDVKANVRPSLTGIHGGEDPEPYAASDLQQQLGAERAIPGHLVELFIDDNETPVATGDADANGSVESFDFTSPVSPGYHRAVVKSVDAQDIESAASTQSRFYVRPATPTITSPASTEDRDAYVNTQPTFTVTGVDAGATVDLYELDNEGLSGESLARVTSEHGGTVTLTPGTPVAVGSHRFVVTQTVTEGAPDNTKVVTSDRSDEPTNVDFVTSAPVLHSDVENNPYTINSQPQFNAHVSGVDSPRVLFIDAKSGQTLGEGGQYGDWTPSAPLADGTYSVYAVAIDDLGHSSAHSTAVDFTIDTVTPVTPSFTSPTDGSIVTTHVPTVTLHGEAGTDMCLAVDLAPEAQEADVVCQTADANGNATLTPNTVLADGPHSLSVSSQDKAYNTSYARANITVKTGTDAPVQTHTPNVKPVPSTPAVTSVTLSSHTVSEGHPVKVGFKLSKPGTVTLTLTKTIKTTVKQKVKIKVKGKTTVVTKTVNKTTTKVVGTVQVKVKKAGKGSYTLTTKFAGHKLGKGKYTLSLKSGKGQSKPVTQTVSVN